MDPVDEALQVLFSAPVQSLAGVIALLRVAIDVGEHEDGTEYGPLQGMFFTAMRGALDHVETSL